MQKLVSIIFCVASLAVVAGVSWLVFPYAARSAQDVQHSSTAQGAEMFEDVELADFGAIPVLDMMMHYIDNPPLEPGNGEKKVRFQGC